MPNIDNTSEKILLPNSPEDDTDPRVMTTGVKELGAISIAEAYETDVDRECLIDGVLFHVDGRLKSTSREAYGFTTTDQEGNSRLMFVYHSDSEGTYRIALGIEKEHTVSGTYMKGDKSNPLHQYTQDTQLHPAFAAALPKMIETLSNHEPSVNPIRYNKNALQYEETARDFSMQMETTEFPDTTLRSVLGKLSSNSLEEYELAERLGDVLLEDLPEVLTNYIHSLNDALKTSGIIPSFDRPTRVEHDQHKLLGNIIREVYCSELQGTVYEWYMASDSLGRVWIDRIREAHSPATAYGTDKQVVYSGILTMKPFDYIAQVDGIPQNLRTDDPAGEYSDVTEFIDTFLPVQQYRKSRAIARATDFE